jgi:hypothetical protein
MMLSFFVGFNLSHLACFREIPLLRYSAVLRSDTRLHANFSIYTIFVLHLSPVIHYRAVTLQIDRKNARNGEDSRITARELKN